MNTTQYTFSRMRRGFTNTQSRLSGGGNFVSRLIGFLRLLNNFLRLRSNLLRNHSVFLRLRSGFLRKHSYLLRQRSNLLRKRSILLRFGKRAEINRFNIKIRFFNL